MQTGYDSQEEDYYDDLFARHRQERKEADPVLQGEDVPADTDWARKLKDLLWKIGLDLELLQSLDPDAFDLTVERLRSRQH